MEDTVKILLSEHSISIYLLLFSSMSILLKICFVPLEINKAYSGVKKVFNMRLSTQTARGGQLDAENQCTIQLPFTLQLYQYYYLL